MTGNQRQGTKMKIANLCLFLFLLLLSACAKTVSPPIESPFKLKFRVIFNASIDTNRFNYFFLVGSSQFPERNENYAEVPMYVPGYRPGETSDHEVQIGTDGGEGEAAHLAKNTTYLNTWSDIITFEPNSKNSFQRCNGPFATPTSFLKLLQLCESRWVVGSSILNSSSTSSTMGFELLITALQNGSNDLDNLKIAILTVEKVAEENFNLSQSTLVDFASGNQGVAVLDLQTKTNELSIYESSCSEVDATKRAACVSDIRFIRTR